MHIDLTEENRDKLLRASNQLDLSISAIVNGLVASVDCVEIEQEIRVRLKKVEESKKPRQVVNSRRFTLF